MKTVKLKQVGHVKYSITGVNNNEPMHRGKVYEFEPQQATIALSRTINDAAGNPKPVFERVEEPKTKSVEKVAETVAEEVFEEEVEEEEVAEESGDFSSADLAPKPKATRRRSSKKKATKAA